MLRARRAVLPLVARYLDLKRSRDALDFSDQMALAARLARSFPDIGAAERSRFRAVLLDEFQDTSEAQLVLLQHLFVAAGEPVPVTAVGDPNQSIYGWRGASATTLTRFPLEFADGSGRADELPLSTSWRNDDAILQVANLTSEPLRLKSPVAVQMLRPKPGAGAGRGAGGAAADGRGRGGPRRRVDPPRTGSTRRGRAPRLGGGPVPQALAVPRRDRRPREGRAPGRGRRARRPARDPRDLRHRRAAVGGPGPQPGRPPDATADRPAVPARGRRPRRARRLGPLPAAP